MALNSMSRKELLKTANPVTEDFAIEPVRHKKKGKAAEEDDPTEWKDEQTNENVENTSKSAVENEKSKTDVEGDKIKLMQMSTKEKAAEQVARTDHPTENILSARSTSDGNKNDPANASDLNTDDGEALKATASVADSQSAMPSAGSDSTSSMQDSKAPEAAAEAAAPTTGASHTALSGAEVPLAEVADIDAKGPSLQATGTAQIQGAATQMQTSAVPMQGNAEQTAANVAAAAEPTRLSEAEEPVLARSFRLLPQTATFIKKRSAFERMPEQSYVNMLFDKYAGIREEVNIMELEPPSLHGASNKSIRLLEHVDAYIADACASYGMKRSEFFNYIVEKEMKAVGWA